jgi:tRNA(Ile)-lysidine synthase
LQATLTVDHGLQIGSASWAQFCAHWTRDRFTTHVSRRLECAVAPDLKRRGVEETARLGRYQALGEMALEAGCQVIALAQHADDQAETVLLQALRGAGPAGLSAMPVWRELRSGVWLWRPLLTCTRAQIEGYVRSRSLSFVHDPSNDDLGLTRNKFRHTLSPVLSSIAPGYRRTLARVAQHAAHATSLLEEVAGEDWLRCAQGYSDRVALEHFWALSLNRQGNLLRSWFARAGLRAVSQARLSDVLRKLRARQSRVPPRGAVLFERNGLQWVLQGDYLVLQTIMPASVSLAQELSCPVDLGALVREKRQKFPELAGELRLVACVERMPQAAPQYLSLRQLEQASAANAHAQLRLRSEKIGAARLKLFASRPSRSLKNLYQEHNVSLSDRLRTPLFYVADQLAGVPGLGMAIGWQAQLPSQSCDMFRLEWCPLLDSARD